jgi:hypothetical protein
VPGASSDIFGLVTLGGSYSEAGTGSRVYSSSVNYAIDLNMLVNPRQDLLVGLLDTRVEGAGFDSLSFQITRESVALVSETFTTVAAAVNFFDDATLNLGSNGFANVSGNLDLVFSLTLTSDDPGAGFYADLLFGNSTIGAGLLPGDFSNDGAVANADLSLLLDNWGEPVPPAPAGWNGIAPTAPAIGNDELSLLLDNWGNVLAGGPFSVQSVPEPSSIVIAWATIAMGLTLARFGRTAD